MKTIRTIIATLSAVLLTFALVAWFSVRRNAAFIQRTIYQGFDQTFVVALVMGCAFLLIAIILTVAIVSTEHDEDDEEDEEEPIRPARQKSRPQSAAERTSAPKGEQAYRRVSRPQHTAQPGDDRDDGFARPKAKSADEQPRQRKQVRAAESPEDMDLRPAEAPVKKVKKPAKAAETPEKVRIAPVPKPQPEEAEEEWAPMAEPVKPDPDGNPVAVSEPAEETPLAPEAPEPEIAEAAPEAAEAAPEAAPAPEEATDAPETVPDAPETIPEVPETIPDERPDPAPAAEANTEEPAVRCVFCGSSVSRDSLYCPHCGKKM